MRRIAYIITVVVFLQIAPSISCLEEGTGLETGGDMRVHVMVENLHENVKQIGLNERLIRGKVELQLRRNGITPVDHETYFDELDYYLYINVNTLGSSCHINVEFKQLATYYVDDKIYGIYAATWHTGTLATHINARNIIDFLLDDIDVFSNEFLSVNKK